MATMKEAQSVKSLNTTPGRRNRRFVFKSFAQRIQELEIDVYRSLDTIKSEPSSGSSFFLDCLIHWRELNTAEDFISFYEEMLPLVQTLPLVLLHKDMIISRLLSRLQMKAHLSLEPILRLTSELSRDLQEDFLLFLPRVIESILDLLKNGADREPEIIEQIFTSWSYIMMYLQKYLTRDVVHILKVTLKLRYYPKDFVQEFMAEALSFLLRNAPVQQLIKGIRKVLSEATRKPSQSRKSGVSALLWHIMRGTSSKFHSRADRLLRLLIDDSILSIGDKFSQGSGTVTDIVIAAFERSCTELNNAELKLMWDCFCEEINHCLHGGFSLHLSRLLSVLISTIAVDQGRKVSDYKPMLKIVESLVKAFIIPSIVGEKEGLDSEAIDKILKLMLGIIDGVYNTGDVAVIPGIAVQWAPAFQLRCSSLLPFLKELLQKDYALLSFRSNIISALPNMVEMSEEEGVDLMLAFCEAMQFKTGSCNVLEGIGEELISKIRCFFQGAVDDWIKVLDNMKNGDMSSSKVEEGRLAFLWGIVCCIPYFLSTEGSVSLMNLVDVLDQLLITETDVLAGISKRTWQSILGAALSSYHMAGGSVRNEPEHTSNILRLAKKYKSSRQILSAVADYLDSIYGPGVESFTDVKATHPELEAAKVVDALDIFAENLYNPDKDLRVSTIRILCHYELLNCEASRSKKLLEQHTDLGASEANYAENGCCNVLKLLHTLEETPVSVVTSRTLTLLVAKIQTCISTSRVSECYVLPAFYGVIGILYNQFMDLSNSAIDCISNMINTNPGLLWDCFISFLQQCQDKFLKSCVSDDENLESFSAANDLIERFHLFYGSGLSDRSNSLVLSLLLRALQKIPAVAESHSRQIVPLYLKFLGYKDENTSVGSFDSQVCKGKDWKLVLREWLNLLQMMKNARSFYRSQLLKDILVKRLLDDNDGDIQTTVLDCLLNWKDSFLLPYEKHLKSLINSKLLREELATWALSKESNLIEDEHRTLLIPVVIRLLMPKVISLRTVASRKHASVNNRKAVLGFIAQLHVDELPLFFHLLMKSLRIAKHGTDGSENWIWRPEHQIVSEFQPSAFLEYFTWENILALPWKKRLGFLHVVAEVFGVFGTSHIGPFIDLLMGSVVRILESCASSLHNGSNKQSDQLEDARPPEDASTSLSVKQFKDMRSLCLKIISLVLNKYEDHRFDSVFWDLFFKSVKPLIYGFKQEGSSSEKPSSLFFCFLAMSQSQNLVSLLCREKSLIPDIFSILSVPTASEAIVLSVLKFTENLLNLELEFGVEKNDVREVILSNLGALVDSLHHLFHLNPEKKRKLLKHPGETVLRVLKLLSKFIRNQSAAKKFVDILLPLACDGIKNSDLCMEALQILKEVIPVLGCKSTSKILNALSPVLISARLDVRLSVCDLFDSLAENDSSLRSMAKLVRELNATSAVEIDALDFDTIINAYDQISEDYFKGIREDQAIVILSHCIFDMKSEDLTLRQRAYGSLLSFVDFSAPLIGNEEKNQEQLMMAVDGVSWTDAQIQRIVNKFLLKHMGDAMSKETAMRKGWIDLLHKMVKKLSGVPSLRTLKALCSEDAEVDFFDNIVHLQIHRRARALSRFSNVVASGQLSELMLKRVFIPLLFSILFDVQTGKAEHLRSACINALASISGQLGWKSYYDLLMRCFRDMTKKPDREKVLLRLVCSILDQFHFSETCSIQDAKAASSDLMDQDPIPSLEVVLPVKSANSTMFSEIQSCLARTVLPQLQKLLVSDSERVNVNVSLAMLKVLKRLPSDTMESQLPSIIYRISNFLKNRLESIRDEARSALASCLKVLGFEYLQFIVGALKATLKRGFEVHVLGYTLHFILSKGLPCSGGGKVDYCLDELLWVIDNDIFGEVAEQKDVEKIASKMKETRKQMSFDTLKLVAQNVTFRTHGLKLLSPVIARLQKNLTPKVKLKLETMLNHIAEGIEKNPSVDQTDLFVFVYGLIDDWLSQENHKSEISPGVVSDKVKLIETSSEMVDKSCTGDKPFCSHLITVFALGLLHNRLRKMKFSKDKDQLLSMLDPFIKLLTSCLSSKYEEVISVAHKCIFPLIRLPLPSLESQADKIKGKLLDIAQGSVNVDSPITQSCLKLLTALLRSTKITLSTDQLHVLVQFPLFIDLEKNPSFVALTLLKAIVRRKLIVHEIYDIVTQVAKLMVTSQEDAIRRKCSQILLQFLLNYQLKEKRRQQHLDFLVANLRYEHATGREAVLEMLDTIIKRFPESIIDKQSQTLFVHLVVALANDHDNQVRSLISIVIKHLISRISSHSLHSILEYCLAWYLGEKQHLWSTSAQVLGFVVEVMKKGFQKHTGSVLPVMRKIMQSALAVLNDAKLNLLDQETIPFWKEAYYSLVLLEKILTQFPDLFVAKDVEDIWQSISEFLMHPHPWICNISSRLSALYFEQMEQQGKKLGTTSFTSTSRLFLIAASLCCLVKVQLADKGARGHVKRNLAYAICGIQSLLRQTDHKDPRTFWSALDPREQGCFLKACRLLDTKEGRSIEASFTYGLDKFDQNDENDISCILVAGLLKVVGKSALQTEDIQTKTILGSLKLIAMQMSQEDCQQHATQLLLPIYKLCEGFCGKVVSDEVKQRAEKVRQKIEEALGYQKFVQTYSQIRHSLGERRDKRKRDEKLMAVVNPRQNAKRKLRISAKHRAHKKRKIMAMKMGRWLR